MKVTCTLIKEKRLFILKAGAVSKGEPLEVEVEMSEAEVLELVNELKHSINQLTMTPERKAKIDEALAWMDSFGRRTP